MGYDNMFITITMLTLFHPIHCIPNGSFFYHSADTITMTSALSAPHGDQILKFFGLESAAWVIRAMGSRYDNIHLCRTTNICKLHIKDVVQILNTNCTDKALSHASTLLFAWQYLHLRPCPHRPLL